MDINNILNKIEVFFTENITDDEEKNFLMDIKC
jgi:hypothetical protein